MPTFGTPEDYKNNEVGKISYLKMALVEQEFLDISNVFDEELIKGIKKFDKRSCVVLLSAFNRISQTMGY